jgi:hypothetical protein
MGSSIVFACMKTRFVEQQVEPGFKVLPPKILNPTLTGDFCQPLVTRLKDARKMRSYGGFRDDKNLISQAIYEANLALCDPFSPPDGGRLFKPLDLELLPGEDHPLYRIAGKDDYRCNFDEFRSQPQKVHKFRSKVAKNLMKMEGVCLTRGAEAVRQVDNPEEWFIESKRVLACSVATIPLAQYLDTPLTPLAAVFSWMEDGKLCSANFHLGDFKLGGGGANLKDPLSKRLRKFIKWNKGKGEFVEVSSSEEANIFTHRWSGDAKTYLHIILGNYFNPDLDGLSLKEQAAKIGFPGPRAELQNKPAAYLDLAARINKNLGEAEIDSNPTLQAIYEELSWQNQAMFKLADTVSARCRAAQAIREEYFKEIGGDRDETGSYLLFPLGVLERLAGGS